MAPTKKTATPQARPARRLTKNAGDATGRAQEAAAAAQLDEANERAAELTMATQRAVQIRQEEVTDYERIIADSGVEVDPETEYEIVIPSSDLLFRNGQVWYDMKAGYQYRIPVDQANLIRGWLWQ